MQDDSIIKNIRITDIDQLVGEKLKQYRIIKGFNQQALAQIANVSTHQIQKYENGINRISSGKLYIFAQFLQIPFAHFFNVTEIEEKCDLSNEREALTLFKAYSTIQNTEVKSIILSLIKAISMDDRLPDLIRY